MLEFKCPKCSFVKSNVSERFSGRKVKCPECGTSTRLPRSGSVKSRFRKSRKLQGAELLRDVPSLKEVSTTTTSTRGFKGYSTNPEMVKRRSQFAANAITAAEDQLSRQRLEAAEEQRQTQHQAIFNGVLMTVLGVLAAGVLVVVFVGGYFAMSRFKKDADQFIEEIAAKNKVVPVKEPAEKPAETVNEVSHTTTVDSTLGFPELPESVLEKVVLGFPIFPEAGWESKEQDIRDLFPELMIEKGTEDNRFFLQVKVLRHEEYVEVSYVFEDEQLVRVRTFRDFGEKFEVPEKLKQTELFADAITSKLGRGVDHTIERGMVRSRTWRWKTDNYLLVLQYTLAAVKDDYYFATFDIERPSS
jgi:hypothetical protein